MSRILAELLGVNRLSFRLNLDQLEHASGDPTVDIRLSTEITQAALLKIKELGLDPKDTTAEELDQALRLRLEKDDQVLRGITGVNQSDDEDTTPSLARLIKSMAGPKKCFALKHSAAKRLLKTNPPKVTLRRLGYRSFDSLMKREPTAVIFIVAALVEPLSWRKSFYEHYNQLRSSDFEVRDIEIFAPFKSHSQQALAKLLVAQERTTVLDSKELGGIILLSPPSPVKASTTTTLILCLQSINNIRIHSAFCKLQQVRPDFGQVMAQALKGDVKSLAVMAGQPVPWQVLQTFFADSSSHYPVELFEPHVQKEDLITMNIEDSLTSILPTFKFWQGTNWLAYDAGGEVVSLNIRDTAINVANNFNYRQRQMGYFRESAWTQLMVRYLQQDELQKNVLEQLDAQLVELGADDNFGMTFAEAT